MKPLTIVNKISKPFQKVGTKMSKHSPEILIVAGVAGTVVGTVMACRATTKLSAILEESKETINHIKEYGSDPEMAEKYSAEDVKKDLAITYIQTGVKVAKLYAPAAAISVLSITSILASNNILRKRNVALVAAYTAIDTSFKEYRSRVVQRFGEEVDKELRYNVRKEKIEEVVVDENGKEKKVKSTVGITDINPDVDYARYFDKDTSVLWEKDPGYNMTFLRAQQAYANNKLRAKGRLFLNDVYKMLGIEDSKPGQIVGWSMDNSDGDQFVDFGIQEVYREIENQQTGEMERVKTILLDFNVDGNIWSLM
jgi:hypothetical protein